MIEEKDLNARTLSETMKKLFEDPQTMASIRENALKMGKGHAAYDIAALADSLIRQGAEK